MTIAPRPEAELDRFGDVVLAPRGTEVRSPGHDVTPADLVTYYVTGEGLQRPPFGADAEANADADADAAADGAPADAATRKDEAG
jgi:methylthioribose-1-phosphate isomerase